MDNEGNIYKISSEPDAVKLEKERMELLNTLQAMQLENVEKEHRHEVLRGLKSKNHNAKRRAKKKIADASRRRNRK